MQAMKYMVILSALLGAVLIYLLSGASANSEFFMHNYYGLLAMADPLRDIRNPSPKDNECIAYTILVARLPAKVQCGLGGAV